MEFDEAMAKTSSTTTSSNPRFADMFNPLSRSWSTPMDEPPVEDTPRTRTRSRSRSRSIDRLDIFDRFPMYEPTSTTTTRLSKKEQAMKDLGGEHYRNYLKQKRKEEKMREKIYGKANTDHRHSDKYGELYDLLGTEP